MNMKQLTHGRYGLCATFKSLLFAVATLLLFSFANGILAQSTTEATNTAATVSPFNGAPSVALPAHISQNDLVGPINHSSTKTDIGYDAVVSPFERGDVFAAVSDGRFQHYDKDGNLLETLVTGLGGFTTGMAFDSTGNFYGTNFSASSVSRFTGPELPHVHSVFFTADANSSSESILFDATGNIYVGQAAGTTDILKFGADGVFLDRFDVAIENRGSDWIDLAGDQRTMFYTSEGHRILRYDVVDDLQLPDFTTSALPGSRAYALRILSDGGVLVADSELIVRLDNTGAVVQTYDVPGEDSWFALNLDPDNVSFWSGNFLTANFYKLDIATGAVVLGPINTGTGGNSLFGLTVFGEITAQPDRPSCSIDPAGPFTINVGEPISFDVTAMDPDSGNTITLTVDALPTGATMTPGLPLPGPNTGIASTFNWAPAADQVGQFLVTFRVTDNTNRQDTCVADITVTGVSPGELACDVQILSPQQELVCQDSLLVTGVTRISDGVPPFSIVCDVNGVAASLADSTFSATIGLSSGHNTIIATCTVTDSAGNQAVCADTMRVLLDDQAPTCQFRAEGGAVVGTFIDGKGGIASISPIEIHNGILTVEPFFEGKKKVDFRIDVIDPGKNVSFMIEVTDVCGNSFVCDPIYLSLSGQSPNRQFDFTFFPFDRYLEVVNHGLSEIRIDLNGKKFKLLTDRNAASRQLNAFPLPMEGRVKIDLDPYLEKGENAMLIQFEGHATASAELFISDADGAVDFVLDLQELPRQFHLAQNYPNPFNPTTTIRFDIPTDLAAGERVQLQIYNILSELVRTLVDEEKQPGEYRIEWDGKNNRGEQVSSGIYLYRLVAGQFKTTKRMILLK